jgi:Mrp family chromosome partitioning ATPase
MENKRKKSEDPGSTKVKKKKSEDVPVFRHPPSPNTNDENWLVVTSDFERNFCYPVKIDTGIRSQTPPTDYQEYAHKVQIITRYVIKGGVGKTTSNFATAYSLAEKRETVLMVDLDPQRNLTQLVLHRTVSYLFHGDYEYFFMQVLHNSVFL